MTRRTAAALLLPLLALGACKDTLAPPPEVQVSLAASTEQPSYGTDDEGFPTIQCTFHFDATAQGDSTVNAEWTRLVLRFFAGPDRSAALDSVSLSGEQIRESFGSASIAAGESQRSSWQVRAGLPFSLEAEAFYRFAGADASAAARTSCGPEPGAGTAPPVLSELTLALPAAPVEPRDSVTVAWKATGAAGLWETGVEIVGTDVVVRFREEQGTTAQRTAKLSLPGILGVPLTLRVYAVDALGRSVSSVELTTPPLVDQTPPEIAIANTQHGLLGAENIWLRGQFGAGDTVPLHLVAYDNHRMSHLVYGAGSLRDSVALDAPGFSGFLRLPTSSDWEGHTEFSLYVRDASGLASEVLHGERMRFYPVRAVPLRHVSPPDRVARPLVDEARGRLWVMRENGAELLSYSLPGLEPQGSVSLPGVAGDMDLSQSGDTLVVLMGMALGFIDLREENAPEVVPLEGMSGVYGMKVSAAGEVVVLGIGKGDSTLVIAYDPISGIQRVVHSGMDVLQPGHGIARSGDGRRMVLGAGCLYDAVGHVLGACAWIPGSGRLSGDRTGATWANNGHVYGANLNTLVAVPWMSHTPGAWITPSGDEVYFNTVDGPLRVRVSDGRYLERFGGMPPAVEITGSSDGRSIVIVHSWPTDRVTHVAIP